MTTIMSGSESWSVFLSIWAYPRADFSSRKVESFSASLASMACLSSSPILCCRLILFGLEIAQLIADFGRFFVIFATDGFVEVHFELLALAQRAFGGHIFQPMLQRLDFRALFKQVGAGIFLVKFANLLDAGFDFRHGSGEIVFGQAQGRLGAGLDHEDLGPKLLQRPDQLVGIGVFLDKIEYLEVAIGIAHHPFVVFQLEETNIAMMILENFELY